MAKKFLHDADFDGNNAQNIKDATITGDLTLSKGAGAGKVLTSSDAAGKAVWATGGSGWKHVYLGGARDVPGFKSDGPSINHDWRLTWPLLQDPLPTTPDPTDSSSLPNDPSVPEIVKAITDSAAYNAPVYFLVGPSPTGAWAGHAGELALGSLGLSFTPGTKGAVEWHFIPAPKYLRVSTGATSMSIYEKTATGWQSFSGVLPVPDTALITPCDLFDPTSGANPRDGKLEAKTVYTINPLLRTRQSHDVIQNEHASFWWAETIGEWVVDQIVPLEEMFFYGGSAYNTVQNDGEYLGGNIRGHFPMAASVMGRPDTPTWTMTGMGAQGPLIPHNAVPAFHLPSNSDDLTHSEWRMLIPNNIVVVQRMSGALPTSLKRPRQRTDVLDQSGQITNWDWTDVGKNYIVDTTVQSAIDATFRGLIDVGKDPYVGDILQWWGTNDKTSGNNSYGQSSPDWMLIRPTQGQVAFCLADQTFYQYSFDPNTSTGTWTAFADVGASLKNKIKTAAAGAADFNAFKAAIAAL